MKFTDPQVIVFVADPERSAEFYRAFGFTETFRTTPEDPVKIEMALDGFMLGLSTAASARDSHRLQPVTEGHRACFTFWTDDVQAGYEAALAAGATDREPPHPFLDGALLVAFVEDPDGHPLQLVQRVA